MRFLLPLFLLFFVLQTVPATAGFWDSVKQTINKLPQFADSQEQPGLSTAEIGIGLREALRLGAERAVSTAASPETGFSNNSLIHIPLPEHIAKIGKTLRAVGLGRQVDLFENTMNEAAEKAAAEAMPILGQAVSEMTIDDARRIWKGGDTAATEYFQEKTRQPISEKFEPVVAEATGKVGVTKYYNDLAGHPLVKSLLAGEDYDLDTYVTAKALDGLFSLLALEEKKIRTDPVARTTEILKKVFGN